MLTAAAFWLFGLSEPASTDLAEFVARPDAIYSWKPKQVDGYEALDLVSQTWQGAPWRHDVVVIRPKKAAKLGAAMIEVTGWTPNARDYAYAQTLADSSGLPVALLFQIPNEPLFGREEDDLIAHTFEKFFETGDPSWPLLFPMVKSVKAAMDALQESTKGSGDPLVKFVVTGASKRGWTSWLVASLNDPRVAGVAPDVFDNLDFVAQLSQQRAYWNSYSPMIADYTDRGLQDLLGTERGKQLIQMVDPANYLGQIKVPVMVLTGTNDPYWTVDSTQVYWGRMQMPKWTIAIPNAGHTMGDKAWWAPSLGLFGRACAEGKSLPRVGSHLTLQGGAWSVHVSATPGPASYKVWSATSTDLHFDKATWTVQESKEVNRSEGERGIVVSGDRAKTLNTAVLVELDFDTPNGALRVTTPVYLARRL